MKSFTATARPTMNTVETPAEPPHSIEAEEHLLSCALLDGPDVMAQCERAGISTRSFYDTRHGVIYSCTRSLYQRGIAVETATLGEELKSTGQLEAIGGFSFLTQVSGKAPTTAKADYFITQVRGFHLLREVLAEAEHTTERANQPGADPAEIVADLRAGLERITNTSPGLGEGITAADLCAKPPPIPPELISGVLYGGGTMMLSGPSKSRKTYTFLDLAVSVATGSDWLGFATAKHGVIYLNFELSEHSFERRLAAICQAKGIKPPANLRSFNLRGKTASMGMLAVELPRLIKTREAGLVILDPWYKISAQSGAEENSNDGQARILAEAERIVTANGAGLVVGHHFAKGDASAKSSIDRAAGAGAMARWGDVIATLSEHEEQDAMALEFHLRDFAPVEPLVLRWEQPLWRRDDSLDPSKLKRGGKPVTHPSAELLDALTNGMTGTEWRTAAKWTESTFRRRRDELISARKVICQMGTYRHA